MGSASEIPLEFSECQSLANDLVADLVLGKGPFREAIERLRREWNIIPETRLPPETYDFHMPPGSVSNRGSAEWIEARLRWLAALEPVLAVVPETLRVVAVDWNQFTSACVLYDPPETQLLEFAELKQLPLSKQMDQRTRLELSGLPIRYTSDGMKAILIEQRRWRRIIDELGRKHLEPLGLEVWELVKDVECSSGFTQQYWEELSENPCRYYIEVGEATSKQSVVDAWREIVSAQQHSDSSFKERDQLLCLQLAILHERYNKPDEEDPRRKAWPYSRLAEKYGDYYREALGRPKRKLTKRAAQEHVKIGKKMLMNAQRDMPR